MDVLIPLDQMTVAEKLRAMETIWNDLQQVPANVPSPAWHEDVLRARETRVNEGKSQYGEWSEAKEWIRQQTR
ncbi:MAG: addiction module protein [Candidatus Hydrogenedentes bacterium]|nr:addiction module protein [Candidatus Hydrogenedentota bacterium]